MLNDLVTITLDKERHLRLSLEGMIQFEKVTGINLLKGFKLKDFTLKDSAALVWACLIHEDEKLTFESVRKMIDIGNMVSAMDAVTECLNCSLPAVEPNSRPLVQKSRRG